MPEEKNEIEKLIDVMISSGDDFTKNITSVLPDSLAESVTLFQESNVKNLNKIKEFLNK